MLRYESGEFLTERIEHLPDDPGDEFVTLGYGADSLEWIGQFQQQTTGRVGGLTIFEGPPGTGKTSFVSLMVRRLAATHAFYVLPVARDGALTAPELVPFWQTQNDRHPDRVKVIVLEDAERLLWSRRGDNQEAVSSILNIADGLLGRMLRLHVLCSVNACTADLDPAILRPGRLMQHRRFPLLPRSAAVRIAEMRSLTLAPDDLREAIPLADALNPGCITPPARSRIGFQSL